MRIVHIRSDNRESGVATDRVEELGLQVAGLTKAWREALDRRLQPLGLSRAQWQALVWLDRAGGALTQGELGERLDIRAPATVALVDRLARDGLVVRRGSASDRRVRMVVVTRRARALQRRIRLTALALRREVRKALTDAELDELRRLLGRTRARLEALDR